MAQIDDLEALAKRHGALSYRNRADTQNPAFGFSVAGLESLLAEVRKQDDALILQMVEALEDGHGFAVDCVYRFAEAMNGRQKDQLTKLEQEAFAIAQAITAARARLEEKPI